MNVYDFDKTIYKKDSSIEIYICVIKKRPLILFQCLPTQIKAAWDYKRKKIRKEQWKVQYFSFCRYINMDEILDEFIKREIKNIAPWYLKQKKKSDLIISASPEFIVSAFAEKLDIKNVIASKVDKNSGKFVGKNCYGKEKVKRFLEQYPSEKVDEFYSDSKTDYPMAKLAQNAYLIKNKWNFRRKRKWNNLNK